MPNIREEKAGKIGFLQFTWIFLQAYIPQKETGLRKEAYCRGGGQKILPSDESRWENH